MATRGNTPLVGDSEQMRTGETPGGEMACYEFRNASHLRCGFPICLENVRNLSNVDDMEIKSKRKEISRRKER